MAKKYTKKWALGCLSCALSAMMLSSVTVLATADASIYGTVAVQTQIAEEYEVVYENGFDSEAEFNAVYEQDVDYGIHPIENGTDGEVKFTYKSNFTGAGLADTNYESTQIRTFNGNSKTKAKGFWIDLDHVLETYGSGAYTFSFRVNSADSPGLIEAVLNTAEDQSELGNILWEIHEASESSPYVNLGGHILISRWDNTDTWTSKINNVTFQSTTYIPEDAEHLRFFFGGTIYDGAANNRNVGGSSTYRPVFFDDLVISKKTNSAYTGMLNLSSQVVSVDGAEHSGRLISALYDSSNMLVSTAVSDVITVGSDAVSIESALDVSGGYDDGYTVKTFFAEIGGRIIPYGIAYHPQTSLFPNNNLESPFTNAYRWMDDSNVISLSPDAAYSGSRGATRGIAQSGTYIKIGESEIPSPGTSAAPGDATALAKVLLENGKGTYRISFMAKTQSGDANLVLHFRPYYQNYSQRDIAIGTIDTPTTRWSVGEQTATPEWREIEFEVTFNPLASGATVTAGRTDGWLSYRKNNYGMYLVGSSVNDTDVLYIDDFKVEKISDPIN